MEQQQPEEQMEMTEKQLKMMIEWIGIENIATLPFHHKRILPDDPDNIDNCTKRTTDCLAENRCKIHIKSDKSKICVSKERISDFRTKNTTISGKYGAEFKVIESGKVTESGDIIINGNRKTIMQSIKGVFVTSEDVDYWYQILETETTKYLLFPTGESSDILQKPNIQRFLQTLSDKLITSNNSYCLCGHSMGCVLALNLGLLIYEKNPAYFLEKITVIGSGPFRWLSEERRGTFDNLPNVFIFVLIYDGYVDWFFQNEPAGETTNGHYSPSFLLDSNNPVKKMSDINIKSEYDKRFQNEIHLWGHYYSAFTAKSSGGKRKPRTRRRTKNKKKTNKKRRKVTIRSY